MRRSGERERLAHLQLLVSTCVETLAALQGTVAVLQAELDDFSASQSDEGYTNLRENAQAEPVIDHGAMCVCYQGKQCFLGNTLMLRFFERLAARPGHYFTHHELLSSVWSGVVVEPCSIRSVVRDLRARLRDAGLQDLAQAINSQVRGHYGFFLHKQH